MMDGLNHHDIIDHILKKAAEYEKLGPNPAIEIPIQ